MSLYMTLRGRIRNGIKKASALVVGACLFVIASADEAAAQSTFTTQSVPDLWTATFVDSAGRTITVRGSPQDNRCSAINAAGYVGSYARSSVPECDRTITYEFETSGFLVQSITFADMDDMDGTGPRDSFAMNVAGTWTSPTIEVHSLSSPPAFADQVGRLITSGAVGTFIANSSGDNPVDETATFTMATSQLTFTLLFDDTQGLRDALNYFDLNNMVIVVAQGSVVAADDSGTASTTTGGTGIANVFTGDTLNGVVASTANTTLGLAPGSTLPTGISFDTATGEVSVAAGTPVGTYSFDYEICELGFASNCDTSTMTVTVTGNVDLALTKTNTPGQNNDVDLADDTLFSGSTTTYTITVTNDGVNAVNGAVITDTPGAGLTCDAANPVTITGDGVPAGSFTIADLTGAGITLGTLSNGQTATLSYSCQVN